MVSDLAGSDASAEAWGRPSVVLGVAGGIGRAFIERAAS